MLKKFLFSLVLAGLSSHAYCQRGFFTPKAHLIFFPTQPNQLTVGLGVGGGLDASVSYVTKGDFQFYGSGLVHKWTSPSFGLFSRNSLKRNDQVWRIGFGPVLRPGDDKYYSLVETFVGFGYAKFDNSFFWSAKPSKNEEGDLTNGSFRNVNVQVNLKHVEKKFEFINSFRLGYFKFDTIFYAPDSYPKQYLVGLSTFNLEPGFAIGYTLNKFVIRGSAGISIPIQYDSDGLFQVDPFNNNDYIKLNPENLGMRLTSLMVKIGLCYYPNLKL